MAKYEKRSSFLRFPKGFTLVCLSCEFKYLEFVEWDYLSKVGCFFHFGRPIFWPLQSRPLLSLALIDQGGRIDLVKHPLQLPLPQLIPLVTSFEFQLMYHQPQSLRHFFVNVLKSEMCLLFAILWCIDHWLYPHDAGDFVVFTTFGNSLNMSLPRWWCYGNCQWSGFSIFKLLVIVWAVFSKVVADARDIVFVASTSSASFPMASLAAGSADILHFLPCISLLLQLFLMRSLSSRPVEVFSSPLITSPLFLPKLLHLFVPILSWLSLSEEIGTIIFIWYKSNSSSISNDSKFSLVLVASNLVPKILPTYPSHITYPHVLG